MANEPLDPRTDLGEIPWLQVLDKAGWNDLLATTELRLCQPSEVIILEGDPPTTFYVIHQGWVKGVKLSNRGWFGCCYYALASLS